jgi:hypothetical protein
MLIIIAQKGFHSIIPSRNGVEWKPGGCGPWTFVQTSRMPREHASQPTRRLPYTPTIPDGLYLTLFWSSSSVVDHKPASPRCR